MRNKGPNRSAASKRESKKTFGKFPSRASAATTKKPTRCSVRHPAAPVQAASAKPSITPLDLHPNEPEPLSNVGVICEKHAAPDPAIAFMHPYELLGMNVKLAFPTGKKTPPFFERMFVCVQIVDDNGACVGPLSNDPLFVEGLVCGSMIEFELHEALQLAEGVKLVELPMRPLVIDEETGKKIQQLIDFAQANRIDFDQMMKIMKKELPPMGDRFAITLPFGWRIAYSIEQQPKKDKTGFLWMRHMSVSIQQKGKFPNPASVEEIAKMFGFPPFAERTCFIYIEDGPEIDSVNVLSVIGEAV